MGIGQWAMGNGQWALGIGHFFPFQFPNLDFRYLCVSPNDVLEIACLTKAGFEVSINHKYLYVLEQ
jgi:hypothetical protein